MPKLMRRLPRSMPWSARSDLQCTRPMFASSRLVNGLRSSEQVIPQSQQTLEVSRVAYQTDRVDFLALIDNQRTVLDARVAISARSAIASSR